MSDHDNGPAVLNSGASRARDASLANLRPWQPGQSGNPSGRPSAAGKLLTWLNELSCETADGKARYSLDELRRIADDPHEPHPKAAAAQMLIRLRSGEWSKSGVPLAQYDLERLLDRFLGKPKQTVQIERPERTIEQIDADIRAEIAANPHLRRLFQSVVPALPAPAEAEAQG